MALVAVCGAVAVTLVLMAMAVMVMTAAAAVAMNMLGMGMLVPLVAMRLLPMRRLPMRLMPMGVLMAVVVMVVRVAVIVAVMVMTVVMMVVPAAAVIAMSVVMDLLLRLERALDRRHGAALPTHELGQSGIIRDIERVRRHFRRDVIAAEMPGEAHQPQRVLGADLQQALRRGLDLHEAAIVELQRIAVVQRCRLVQIDREFEPARRLHGNAATVAILISEAERIDDTLGADGGPANDGSGAKHVR